MSKLGQGLTFFFDRNTYDQLFQQRVHLTTGFNFVRTYFGQVKNCGVDFSFSSRNVDKEWTWDTDIVMSFLKNEQIQLVVIGRCFFYHM